MSLKKSRSGFTLTEMAIVLGVAGAIIGAIWSVSTMVSQRSEAMNAVTQLNIISQNMVQYGQSGYGLGVAGSATTPITSAMITAGVIPSWARTTATSTTASSPWNSTGFAMYWISGSPRMFRESFYNLPSARACITLVMNGITCANAQSGCVSTVYTGGSAGGGTPTNSSAASAMTSAEANTLCGDNTYTAGSGANSVEFDFYM